MTYATSKDFAYNELKVHVKRISTGCHKIRFTLKIFYQLDIDRSNLEE